MTNGEVTLTNVNKYGFLVQFVMTSDTIGIGAYGFRVYFSTDNGSSWRSSNYRYVSHKVTVGNVHTIEYVSTSAAYGMLGLTGSSTLVTVGNMPASGLISHAYCNGAWPYSSASDSGVRHSFTDYTTTEAHNAIKFDWVDSTVDIDYVVYVPA